MKNKFFVLGMLIALFAITLPLYADPGGSVIQGDVSTASVDQFTADVAMPAVASVSIKSVIQFIAGGVAALVGVIVAAIGIAPFLKTSVNPVETYRDKNRPNLMIRLFKRSKSPVLKSA